MKQQQCYLWAVWSAWLALPLIAIAGFVRYGWIGAAVGIVLVVGFQIVYIVTFPRISGMMGYGSVEDRLPEHDPLPDEKVHSVTLYTASACPFCPLVRKRLRAIGEKHHLEISEVDVTFRPELVSSKGLKAVPAVEANGQLRVGNLTTAELLALIHPSAA